MQNDETAGVKPVLIPVGIAKKVGSTVVDVELHLELDVIAAFKMIGPDWRRRMEAVLSDAAHYLRPMANSDPSLLSALHRPDGGKKSGEDSVQILHRGGGWVVRVYENNEITETRHSLKAAASMFAGDEIRRLQLT